MDLEKMQTAAVPSLELGQLFTAHHQMLSAVLRRRHRSLFDVEDILQNIFLKLHQKIKSFHGRSKVQSWLYRIAVNESIDFYRKHRHDYGESAPLQENVPDCRAEAPDRGAEHRELRRRVEGLVEKLEANLKVIFKLYFFEERRVEEISRLLAISPNAVRCRIYKAKLQVLAGAENSGIISN